MIKVITVPSGRITKSALKNIQKREEFYAKFAEKHLNTKMKYPTDMASVSKRYETKYAKAKSFNFDMSQPAVQDYYGFIQKALLPLNALQELNRMRKQFVERAIIGIDRTDMSPSEKRLAIQGVKRFANRAKAAELSQAYESWFMGLETFYDEQDESREAFFRSLDEAMNHKKFGKKGDYYNTYVNIHQNKQ